MSTKSPPFTAISMTPPSKFVPALDWKVHEWSNSSDSMPPGPMVMRGESRYRSDVTAASSTCQAWLIALISRRRHDAAVWDDGPIRMRFGVVADSTVSVAVAVGISSAFARKATVLVCVAATCGSVKSILKRTSFTPVTVRW